MMTANQGHIAVVQALLEAGADTHIKDNVSGEQLNLSKIGLRMYLNKGKDLEQGK